MPTPWLTQEGLTAAVCLERNIRPPLYGEHARLSFSLQLASEAIQPQEVQGMDRYEAMRVGAMVMLQNRRAIRQLFKEGSRHAQG